MTSASIVKACTHCGQQNRVPVRHLTHTGKCGNCKNPLPPLAEPIDLDPELFDAMTNEAPAPLIIDFWAAWCGPCRMMAPELAKLAASHAGRVLIGKVDTEQYPDLAARHHIEALPTLIVFRDGQPRERLAGARTASALARELSL